MALQSLLSFVKWQRSSTALETLSEENERQVVSHLTHVEDLVLTSPERGQWTALQTLYLVYQALKGESSGKVNISVKFDGAPAIIVGNDPADGQFFVATKGAFSKTPKIAKTEADLDALYGQVPGLLATMRIVFRVLKPLQWTHILQGDVMFTPASKAVQNVDGVEYMTFTPNTITYGVPFDTPLGRRIRAAELGVAFHTTYRGESLSTMTASSGANVSGLGDHPDLVLFSPKYPDLSGDASLTATESRRARGLLSRLRRLGEQLRDNAFHRALRDDGTLRGLFMQFQNTLIKAGVSHTAYTPELTRRWQEFLSQREAKELTTRKTEKGQASVRSTFAAYRDLGKVGASDFAEFLEWQDTAVELKRLLMDKLQRRSQLATFYTSDAGLIPGEHEGFVATDRKGSFVKLVDRANFSRQNFLFGPMSRAASTANP